MRPKFACSPSVGQDTAAQARDAWLRMIPKTLTITSTT